MPLDANEIEDLVSSTDPALDEQAVEPAAADAKSSNATGDTENGDLLSVVRDVVTESRKADQTASPAEGETGQGAKPGAEDDYSDVPFNAHPRFKELVREKNAHKAEAKRYQQDAEQFRKVQDFMESNGLMAEEAADLLIIGGLMKTNPAEAWRRMKPAVQQLLIAAGEVLPDDLQGRVQRGELSADAALEVSRMRAGMQSVQATRSFEQRRAETQRQRDTESALRGAADTWQAERERKDPLFAHKIEPLMDRVARMQRQEGVPNTPQGVRDQLNRAYQGLVASGPRTPPAGKQPVAPVRGGQVAGDQRPQTGSTLDIIRANRRTGAAA